MQFIREDAGSDACILSDMNSDPDPDGRWNMHKKNKMFNLPDRMRIPMGFRNR